MGSEREGIQTCGGVYRQRSRRAKAQQAAQVCSGNEICAVLYTQIDLASCSALLMMQDAERRLKDEMVVQNRRIEGIRDEFRQYVLSV